MVNMSILERHGVSTAAWKTKFTANKVDPKIDAFRKRAWNRAQNGVTENMTDFRIIKAIDAAWDTPLRQITPTLLTNYSGECIVNTDPDAKNVLEVFKSLNLSKYLVEETDAKTGKPTGRKTLDIPSFFSLIIPLVKPYVTIRWAKLCNDRDVSPFFKYDPNLNSAKNRLKCAILDHRTDVMASQFGYAEARKQAILGMLLYPESYQFIESEWLSEKTTVDVDGVEKDVYTREGLTYHRPHPTRVYRDKAHPGYTLLTDTGCRWIGYWRIKRYSELVDDTTLWNSDRISMGADWSSVHPAYFSAFASCIMSFPQVNTNQNSAEAKLSNNFYTSDQADMGTMVVEHFEKIIPANVGLGTYKHPIWARFVFAGEGTMLYAAPLPGVPAIYYGDTVDGFRDHNASMALEIVPFQDALTNTLNQVVLSSKQNLAGVTWVDTDLVSTETIKDLKNAGEAFYRSRKFVEYSSRKTARQQTDPKDAIFSTSFPWLDVNSLMTCFNTILNMLERVLQISPQELGGSASHEQSAEEVKRSSAGSGNRFSFTSSSVDRSTAAWKKQVYDYLMAFGEDEIWAQLPVDDMDPLTLESLAALGFSVEEHDAEHITVKGSKTAIDLEYFASTKDGADRADNKTVANSMTQVFLAAMNNPMIAQALGPEQAITLLNTIIHWLGLPKDFKLRAKAAAAGQDPQVMQQVMGEVQKAIAQSSQQTLDEVQKAMAPIVDEIKKLRDADNQLAGMNQQTSQAVQKIVQLLPQFAAAPVPTPPQAYDSQIPETMPPS